MENTTNICRLCGRALGDRSEAHHVVPKSKGGRQTVLLHPICHRKIHRVFTNKQLADFAGDLDALKTHPEIAAFIKWLQRKPPDFHAPTR
ncbi:MAG: HNH endonuclease [Pseudomonadota bacterium]